MAETQECQNQVSKVGGSKIQNLQCPEQFKDPSTDGKLRSSYIPEKLSQEAQIQKDDQITLTGEIGEIEAVKSNYSKRLETVANPADRTKTEIYDRILKAGLSHDILNALRDKLSQVNCNHHAS